MYNALSRLATATTWQPTIDRMARILAYHHAQGIGHPAPDVYAQEHWRRELFTARGIFAALTHPYFSESLFMRIDIREARLERADIFLAEAARGTIDDPND